MTAETLSPRFALPPKPRVSLTRAQLRDIVESVVFHTLLGLGIGVPILLGTLGEFYR